MGRYAIIDESGTVTNVAAWDGEAEWAPPDGHTAIPADGAAALGDYYSGQAFHRPPTLTAEPTTIPADSTTPSSVTYRNTRPDAPATVTFDVNGATHDIALTNSEATLEIVANTPGTITITAENLTLNITVEA